MLFEKFWEMIHATIWALIGLAVGSVFHASLKSAVILTVLTAIFGCVGT